MAQKYPIDWACSCGKRHTGLPQADLPEHKPVSVWEARFANSRLAGKVIVRDGD